MANRHAGKIGDVWKHLALAELLAIIRPTWYVETHAGNAVYRATATAERGYGALGFLDAARRDDVLGASRYHLHLRQLLDDGDLLPGSPALAMAELGGDCRYLLCDIDPDSTADIDRWAGGLGIAAQVTAVAADGMRAVADEVLDGTTDPTTTFVHIDPYDPHASIAGSVSAVALARQLIAAGVQMLYWYGFDAPHEQLWALEALRPGSLGGLWCGAVTVTTAAGGTRGDGHLGTATTPGTGCGVVCVNIGAAGRTACDRLGRALADAYHGVGLPSGEPGALRFTTAVA